MSDKTTLLLLEAVRTKFLSDLNANLAIISNYLESPVGVADHPDVVSDLAAAIQNAAAAIEGLDFMKTNYFQKTVRNTTQLGLFFEKL